MFVVSNLVLIDRTRGRLNASLDFKGKTYRLFMFTEVTIFTLDLVLYHDKRTASFQ